MIFYTTLILAVAAASRTSEVRAAAEEPSVSSSFLMSEFEAAVMTDDDDQQRELFKTTKSVKKNSKDSHHYFQSLCNIHLFEGKFEYQNGCEQTTVATVVGGSKDTGYYTETLLDGVSSCSLIHRRTEESDSKEEEEEDDQCSVGKPNRFIGGAFNAKAAIAYNKRTGDCELMYTDLPTDPCDVYPHVHRYHHHHGNQLRGAASRVARHDVSLQETTTPSRPVTDTIGAFGLVITAGRSRAIAHQRN